MSYVVYGLVGPDSVIFYVGVTRRLVARMKEHSNRLGFLPGHILLDPAPSEPFKSERLWIWRLRSAGIRLTNKAPAGGGGRDVSEATRRRLSESSRAYMNRPEVIERYREVRSRPKSEETRRKMAERATGRTLSDDVKSRISAANRGRKQVVEPDRGEKISAAKKGMVMTEAHRRALSAAKRGRKRGPLCAETRAKIAAGRRAYFAARAAE